MREARGDLFQQSADSICITTNGATDHAGRAIMGRGCALRAAQLWPSVPSLLNAAMRAHGHRVHQLSSTNPSGAPVLSGEVLPYHLVAFPVKPVAGHPDCSNVLPRYRAQFRHTRAPGWACYADADLIRRSAEELRELADAARWSRIVLPRPGCGAGELRWDIHVRPLLAPLLDDRFVVITF